MIATDDAVATVRSDSRGRASGAAAARRLDSALLGLALALVVGLFVRFLPVLSSDFPLNDGGMFLAMVQDLRQAHYALPAYTSYNAAHIPFAYPPLAFYLAALLADVGGWSPLTVLRFLPALFSALTIPAFYVLCRRILPSGLAAGCAVVAFALLPRGYEWLIMGGGLTRAPGFCFALVTLHQAHRLYTDRRARFIVSTSLCAGLTILSHAEMAWFAAYSVALLFLFYGRTRRDVVNSLLVAPGVLLLTAPWWLTILLRFGPSPLLAATQSGQQGWSGWPFLLTFDFTNESFLPLIAVLGLLGLFACLADRRYFLPAWLVVIFVIQPRSARTFAMVPLAMLAAVAVERVALPAFQRAADGAWRRSARGWLPLAVLGYFLAYCLFSSSAAVLTAPMLRSLPSADRAAMTWVAANTPRASAFAVVPTVDEWAADSTSEWFPVLARRTSVATVQGHEWLPNDDFARQWARSDALIACREQDAACLEQWGAREGVAFDYVYLPLTSDGASPQPCCEKLATSLRASADFRLVYDVGGVAIFARTGGG